MSPLHHIKPLLLRTATRMQRARAVLMSCALLLSACGGEGGDWIDAPESCQKIAFVVEGLRADLRTGKHVMTIEEGKALDAAKGLNDIMEQTLRMATRSQPPAKVAEMRKTAEQLVAQFARETCGCAGKSFTGTWDCSGDQQRVQCK